MSNFNLNRNASADYSLKERQIAELIRLYGVEVDFIKTSKLNVDKVLKDFSHLKIGKEKIKITILPEASEGWEGNLGFDMWGLHNQRIINFFISKDDLKKAVEFLVKDSINYSPILNSILVLPSGTIMEITDYLTPVDGVNNLFTYADKPSVYRLTTKVYNINRQNEVEKPTELEKTTEDVVIEDNFDDIDAYFKMLDDENVIIEEETKKINLPDDHSIHDETQSHGKDNSVFGSLG